MQKPIELPVIGIQDELFVYSLSRFSVLSPASRSYYTWIWSSV